MLANLYSGRLRKADFYVEQVALKDGRRLVEMFHYAKGGSNTATYMHGLFSKSDGALVGITWWIPPTKSAALATYPRHWQGVLSLSRMVIAPGTPKNAATFLLSRSVKKIDREKWPCLVTYADEWQGHTGLVYAAAGWRYVGKTKPERTYIDGSGRMIARKAGPKTRTHSEMLSIGASCIGSFAKHKFVNSIDDLQTKGKK